MKRWRVTKIRDRKRFAKTASGTKAINVGAYAMRGGVRL